MLDPREDLELYLDQVTDIFRELFGIAHAITDQYDAAEYVVQTVIQAGFDGKRSRKITFRDQMLQQTIRMAAEHVRQHGRPNDGEGTWGGFDSVNVAGNPFLMEAVREPILMRRILMMKFGAGLHSYEIAPIVGWDKARVRGYLRQFEARVERKMHKSGSSYEKLARRAARQELNRVDADVPDAAATFRQLQADMVDPVRPNVISPVRKAMGVLVMGVAIVLCVAIFWLLAVLMENNRPASVPPVPQITEQPQQ